jgi:hypothetical protein
LPTLRMCTAPPLAVDRLIGLAGASKNAVRRMEEGKLPTKMGATDLEAELIKTCRILSRLLDRDIFPWLEADQGPTDHERDRASTIVADRLCSAVVGDIVRSAQRKRQYSVLAGLLDSLAYHEVKGLGAAKITNYDPGTYSFDVLIPVAMGSDALLPVDLLVNPIEPKATGARVLLDVLTAPDAHLATRSASAAAKKHKWFGMTYGDEVPHILMLGGIYDASCLGFLASEGIDWIWQHRVDDLAKFLCTASSRNQNFMLQLG